MSDDIKLAQAPITDQKTAVQEMVKAYPSKVAKKRGKQIIVRDSYHVR